MIISKLATSHALCACNEVFFFWFSENVEFSGSILLQKQKLSLFFIFNFYFENLIYK